MTEPAPYTEDDVALVAAATEQHYIVADRTDAMGNSPCVCDQWWDAAGDNPGWDQHMAEVTLAALANAGRLLPEDARTETVYGVRLVWDAGDHDVFEAADLAGARVRFDYHVHQKAEQGVWLVTPHLVQRTETHAVGPWVPVADMSTAPDPSVGAHTGAHSAHIPDVPEEKP